MHILFVHQNFPAQFGHIAGHLVQKHGYRCTFVSELPDGVVGGIRRIQYRPQGGATAQTPYFTSNFENAVAHAHGVYEACRRHPDLKPDLIVGHSGFGSTLFLNELFPCPIINYFELLYRPRDSDMDYRPEFAPSEMDTLRAYLKNAMILLDLQNCRAGYCPTPWQKSTLPGAYADKVEVIFDGIDTEVWRRHEGLPRKTFWRDGDGDGAGDGQGMSLQACAAGPGFVDNGADCNDADPQVMPGAPERCNGQDDNCNGLQDEDVQGTGADCLEPSRVGVCQSGRTACVNAEIVCRQHVLPSEETCNGLDDDCDGVVDQAPGCGGPPSLLAESGVSFGARNLGDTGLADVSTCLKSTAAGTADLFSSGTWLITGPTRHVAWVEKSSGTWDLSKPGLGLRLAMTRSCYTGCINPLWAPPVPQPVVLLCGPDGAFARYEPESSRLLVGGVGSDDLVPLAGGGGWRLVTPAADLSRIRRIEVVFQPNTDGQSNPNLRVVFGKLGFEPVP